MIYEEYKSERYLLKITKGSSPIGEIHRGIDGYWKFNPFMNHALDEGTLGLIVEKLHELNTENHFTGLMNANNDMGKLE